MTEVQKKKREESIISLATLNYYYPNCWCCSYAFENVLSFLGQLFPLHRINESITSDIGANSRLVILLIGSQRQNSFQSFRSYAHSCLYGVQGKSYFGNLFGLEISSHQTFTKHCKQKFKEEKFILQGVQDQLLHFRDTEKARAMMKSRPQGVHVQFVMIIFANQQNYIASTYFAKNVFQLGSIGKPRVQCVELR